MLAVQERRLPGGAPGSLLSCTTEEILRFAQNDKNEYSE